MAVKWTDEQRQVISSRGENLLVSAAAGSGKTAVLVQHVIERITDPADPVSVQDLLIVTFTRAAAAEMKDRLRRKMEEVLSEEPDNYHLRRQISLIDQAQICTIDSFCSWVVRNYFHTLDIDPDFRIVNDTEATLLREDVLSGVMEDAYRTAEPDFLRFMDSYSTVKSDSEIRKLILRIAHTADCMPRPDRWFQRMEESPGECNRLSELPGAADMYIYLRSRLEPWRNLSRQAAEICDTESWLSPLALMFRADCASLDSLLGAEDTDQLVTGLAKMKLVRKASISAGKIQDQELYDDLRSLRDNAKKALDKLKKDYGTADPSALAVLSCRCSALLRIPVRLAHEFRNRYQQAKGEKNLAEFSDVAHWALQILTREEDGLSVPTDLALELGSKFREIMIDEYQDSNLIQEELLTALSGEHHGKPDMFMVGDVKQSIYKFRQARPDLFLGKYDRYSYESGGRSGRKIDLGRNFRSRSSILDEINAVFTDLMSRENGGIEYDDHARLWFGADYYEGADPSSELILIEEGEDESEDTEQELEARVIAEKIREMTDEEDPLMIRDKDTGRMRPVVYSDIIVLVRSREKWGDTIQNVLTREGIPAYTDQTRGYFSAPEVQLLMSILALLDNPLQDIPLAAVMRSPIGGFTDAELSEIAASQPDDSGLTRPFWNRCRDAAAAGTVQEKWNHFEERILRWRQRAVTMSIDGLLEFILEETGYGLLLTASIDGPVCMANVEMLMEQARAFETTMYHGIFNFIRYMDTLRTYDVDYGEASSLSEDEELVRITTIHQSKGLEYPVVILPSMGKQFNMMDTRSAFLIDEKGDIFADAVDPDRRIRTILPQKHMLAGRMAEESRHEEMRILYVALTRAREKLILTGSYGKKQEEMTKLGRLWRILRTYLPADESLCVPSVLQNSCSSYMDWLALTVIDRPGSLWTVRHVSEEEIVGREAVRMGAEELLRSTWLEHGFTESVDPEVRKEWETADSWIYPWSSWTTRKSVLSVSELKHESAEKFLEQQEGFAVLPRQKKSDYENGRNDGAMRGTGYHLVLEKLSPSACCSVEAIRKGLEELCMKGILAREVRDMISPRKLYLYYSSGLGRRMAAAEMAGSLYREQPFVMSAEEAACAGDKTSVPDSEASSGEPHLPVDSEDFVLVQGIIDAFMVEDNEIVLWDYKTDRVPDHDGERYLTGLYREQLMQYKKALEKARGQHVREVWIYSFALDRMIPVE